MTDANNMRAINSAILTFAERIAEECNKFSDSKTFFAPAIHTNDLVKIILAAAPSIGSLAATIPEPGAAGETESVPGAVHSKAVEEAYERGRRDEREAFSKEVDDDNYFYGADVRNHLRSFIDGRQRSRNGGENG